MDIIYKLLLDYSSNGYIPSPYAAMMMGED